MKRKTDQAPTRPTPLAEPHPISHQRLRLQRFAMTLATYSVIILATFLTTKLGFGHLDGLQWAAILSAALLLNLTFFVLFISGANLRFRDPSLTWVQIFVSACWGMVGLHYLWQIRPILLLYYIAAFSFGMLRLSRRRYLQLVMSVMALYGLLLLFEYHQPRPGFDPRYELFVFISFGILLTWFAMFGGFISDIRRHLRQQKEAVQRVNAELKAEMEERRRAQVEKDKLIVELQDALSKVKTLSGLLPICAACKKIRDDQGYWNHLEHYISCHSDAEFSHSICPECTQRLYGDLDLDL